MIQHNTANQNRSPEGSKGSQRPRVISRLEKQGMEMIDASTHWKSKVMECEKSYALHTFQSQAADAQQKLFRLIRRHGAKPLQVQCPIILVHPLKKRLQTRDHTWVHTVENQPQPHCSKQLQIRLHQLIIGYSTFTRLFHWNILRCASLSLDRSSSATLRSWMTPLNTSSWNNHSIRATGTISICRSKCY